MNGGRFGGRFGMDRFGSAPKKDDPAKSKMAQRSPISIRGKLRVTIELEDELDQKHGRDRTAQCKDEQVE